MPSDIHLAHRGIDETLAGHAALPVAHLFQPFVVPPGETVPAFAPVVRGDVRRVPDQVLGELAPGHFLQEMLGARLAVLHCPDPGMPESGGRYFAPGQVLGELRGRGLGRVIAARLVGCDPLLDEGVEAIARGLFPDAGIRLDHGGAAGHGCGKAPIPEGVAFGLLPAALQGLDLDDWLQLSGAGIAPGTTSSDRTPMSFAARQNGE